MTSRFQAAHALSQGTAKYQVIDGTGEFCDAITKSTMEGLLTGTVALWDLSNVNEMVGLGAVQRAGRQLSFEDVGLTKLPTKPPFPRIWGEFPFEGGGSRLCGYLDQTDDRTMILRVFQSGPGETLFVHPVYVYMELDDQGQVPDELMSGHWPATLSDEDQGNVQRTAQCMAFAMLAAFAFSHCKNVELVERLPKRHEQREAKRRGEPILKYHEIVIDPKKPQKPSTGAKRNDDHPAKALHFVRGHFATYTSERPLFGKYTGTYWVPAHVRGDAEAGMVKSTYLVQGGAE